MLSIKDLSKATEVFNLIAQKSVDKTGCAWYYSQALERDGKKPKAKSLKGKPLEREHRTLKIKQREKEWNL